MTGRLNPQSYASISTIPSPRSAQALPPPELPFTFAMLQRLRHKISANRLGGSSSSQSGVSALVLGSPVVPFPHPSSPTSAFNFALDCSSAAYTPVSAHATKLSPRSCVRHMDTQSDPVVAQPYEVDSMPLTPQATPPLVLDRMMHPFSPRELSEDTNELGLQVESNTVQELGMSQLLSSAAVGLGLTLGAQEPRTQASVLVPEDELRVSLSKISNSDSSLMSSRSEGDILALLDRSFPSPPARTALLNEINLDVLASTASSDTTTLCSRTPSPAVLKRELAPSIVLGKAIKVVTDDIVAAPSWTSTRLQLQEQDVGIVSSGGGGGTTLASRRKRIVPTLLPPMPPPPSTPLPSIAGRTASRLVYLKDGHPSSPGTASGLISTPTSARSVQSADNGRAPGSPPSCSAVPRTALLASPQTPSVLVSAHSQESSRSKSSQQPARPPLLQSFSSSAPDSGLRRMLESYSLPSRHPVHTPRDSLSATGSRESKSNAVFPNSPRSPTHIPPASQKLACSHPPEMVCFAGCSASPGPGLSFASIAEALPLPSSPLPRRRSMRLSMRRPSASSITSRIQSIYQPGFESKVLSPSTNTVRKKRSTGTLRSCKSSPTLAALVSQEADEAEAWDRQAAFVAALGSPDLPSQDEPNTTDVSSRAESIRAPRLHTPTVKSFGVLRMKSLSRLAQHVRAATASVRSSASAAQFSPRKPSQQLQSQQTDKQHDRERTSEDSFGPAERAPSPEHGLPVEVARKLRDRAAANILRSLPQRLFEPFANDGRDFTVDMDLTDKQTGSLEEQLLSTVDPNEDSIEELADTSKDSETSHTKPFDFELSFTTAPLDRSDHSADTSWNSPSGDEQGDDSVVAALDSTCFSTRQQLKRQSSLIQLPYDIDEPSSEERVPMLLLNNDRLV